MAFSLNRKNVIRAVNANCAPRASRPAVSSKDSKLTGTVASIDTGAVMTIVKIDLDGGQQITASVTKDAVEDLGLQVGSSVVAVIKATEVMVGVE